MSDDTPQAVQAQDRAAPGVTAAAHQTRAQAQHTREHIPDALGAPPVLRDVRIGRCTEVHDAPHHRAKFDIGLPEGPVPVYYWPTRPAVGSHWAVRTASQHLERWTRTSRGGTVRWLYYRRRTAGVLDVWRVRWPLTADRVPEAVLVVPALIAHAGFQDGGSLAALMGAHTGTRQVYLVGTEWGGFAPGAIHDVPPAATTRLLALPDWGFTLGTPADTGTLYAVDAVLDDDGDDAAAVGLLGAAPAAVLDLTIDFTVPALDVHVPSQIEVVESADAGATWGLRASTEYFHPVRHAADPTSYSFVPTYPLVTEPLGGWFAGLGRRATGGVLAASLLTLAAGTRAWVVPTATIVSYSDPEADVPNTYTASLVVVPAGGSPTAVPLTDAPGTIGVGTQGEVIPDPLWVRQAADGTWVVYGRFNTSTPTEVDPGFWGAPTRWARGTGALTALTWESIGGSLPAVAIDELLTGDLLDPWHLLAVAADGAALVAWSAGTDGDGQRQRLMSDDAGTTWAAVPDGLGLRSAGDDPGVYDDLLFVDIPADDARA